MFRTDWLPHWRMLGVLVALVFSGVAAAQVPAGVANGGLETLGPDQKPEQWFFITNSESVLRVEAEDPAEGARCALLDATAGKPTAESFTNLMQSVAAGPFRGKKVRLRAAVRTADGAEGSKAQLWMRVDRKPGEGGQALPGAFDNMDDRPIRATEWEYFPIVLAVAPDAERIALGLFVIGSGKAWLDDVTLEVVPEDTPVTRQTATTGGNQISPEVRAALARAEEAPRQAFFTWWLLLPLLAGVLFAMGVWPEWKAGSPPAGELKKLPPDPSGKLVGSGWSVSGRFRNFAFRFTFVYWLLFCLPPLVPEVLGSYGFWFSSAWNRLVSVVVTWTGSTLFGLTDPLVPPNGSGDTTWNYLEKLVALVLALVVAMIWSAVDWRRQQYRVLGDWLYSLLRYSLAATMLGYGLAKVGIEFNQFPVIGVRQLDKTWGDSSPMNVLWAFMGASRPYTVFAGLGEVVGALLLVWRRTATIGALVVFGVMLNVAMLNFCYDVPVKIYSTHLAFAALMILAPDVVRLFQLLVLNHRVEPREWHPFWRGVWLVWTRRVLKTAAVIMLVVLPVYGAVEKIREDLQKVSDPAAVEKVRAEREQYRLTRRGFRWINEVPFNR